MDARPSVRSGPPSTRIVVITDDTLSAEIGTAWWRTIVPMVILGSGSIVGGGLVAAVTGPTEWANGSWVAAFLVLVAGVAQLGLAAGQVAFGSLPSPQVGIIKAVLWNIGCVAVIIGTLATSPITVAFGSVPLLAVLVVSLVASRGVTRWPMTALLYRALLGVLTVSIPIGIALAWIRR